MRASRGMGAIAPSKMPKKKIIKRKDNPEDVEMFKKGGKVNLPASKNVNKVKPYRKIK
jgi:hypothetical protein